MPDEHESFEIFLEEKIRSHGLSFRKLSEMTGITTKHIENLAHGKFDDLPPAPYLRGYLEKLGTVLDFDGDAWWETLRREGMLAGSGEEDRLPENRFAQKPFKKGIWVAIVLAVFLSYLGFRSSAILGKPALTLLSPEERTSRTETGIIIVRGTLTNGSRVRINNEEVRINPQGYFQKEIALQPGLNTIEVVATKLLGRETKIIRQIFYEPGVLPAARPPDDAPQSNL